MDEIYGSYGIFEPVTDPDFDWDAYYAEMEADMAAFDAIRASDPMEWEDR